jgi:UDP-N-acetylglucosamine 2-epimerase
MKIASIVGARPEFIQAMPVSRALREKHREILIHTGQHYDYLMSETFFDELEIPAPDYNLEVGSGTHAQQTGEILFRLEEVLLSERPDILVIRGDTNSTLAGALASSKLHIPTAHIEAGERSYDRRMPEEINRLVADTLADYHFCVSHRAVDQLTREGIINSVHWVGDVMLDAMLIYLPIAKHKSNILKKLNLKSGSYSLVTIHRAANTDDPERLHKIVKALNNVNEKIVFPAHPRTKAALQQIGAILDENVKLIDPIGYLDMMALEANARLIATDSGGVQREAYYLSIPCLTLRDETEWTETVEIGWNKLVGVEPEHIINAWWNFSPPTDHPPIYGDGTAAEKITRLIS